MTEITSGDALVPYTGADAAATRDAIVSARVELERRRLELQAAQDAKRAELEQRRRDLEAEFQRARNELAEQMAPLQEQLKKMVEVMWTVDLYLGRGETLRLVRDGDPAPTDTPITVRQKVLVMAEESLLLMGEGNTGVTADDVPEFVEWLAADDAHLNQVLPEQKGVVVLIPTRVPVKSGNAYEDVSRDAANRTSSWLLRNGGKLYLLNVDENLNIGERILPLRREFVDVFDQQKFGFSRREPVRPGSDEWFKLEAVADARRRHYMRIMLILQGLVDRTPVWHPLPPSKVNFMSIRDQDAGKVKLIQDAEQSIQLGDGGETFAAYQARMNKLMRPGLRVIGDWHSQGFRELYESSQYRRGGHPRLFPESVSTRPEAGVPHLIEGRKDGGYVIRFDRTDKVYRRNVPVEDRPGYVYRGEMPTAPQKRASCVVKVDDNWVLPLDVVTVPELQRFLASREERSKHFLSMVPVIRAALAAKQAEAEQEADFRDLIGRLLIMEGAPADEATALVDDLVHWWKLAHTWAKPLNGDGAHEKKAADQIIAEYRSRQKAAADNADMVVEAGRTVPGVIAVARDRQGRWFAYAPSEGALEPGVFLDVTRIRRDGTLDEPDLWRILATRSASALNVAWSDPAWDDWVHGKNPRHYLTGPQRQQLVDAAISRAEGAPLAVTELWDKKSPETRTIQVWWWAASLPPAEQPVEADSGILGRHSESPVLADAAWAVARDGEPVLGERSRNWRMPHSFTQFSGGSRWGHTPWWPDDAYQYGDARPRLLWSDESALDAVADYAARCAAAAEAKRDELSAQEKAAYRYSTPMCEAIDAAQIAEIRAQFEHDYGRDADDLWDAHLKTLNRTSPIHPRDVWRVVHFALTAGKSVAGRTLDDLADDHANNQVCPDGKDQFFWRPERRIETSGYGHLVFAEPATGGAA